MNLFGRDFLDFKFGLYIAGQLLWCGVTEQERKRKSHKGDNRRRDKTVAIADHLCLYGDFLLESCQPGGFSMIPDFWQVQ